MEENGAEIKGLSEDSDWDLTPDDYNEIVHTTLPRTVGSLCLRTDLLSDDRKVKCGKDGWKLKPRVEFEISPEVRSTHRSSPRILQ